MAAEREELEIGELLAHEGWMRRVAWKVLGEGSDVDDVVQEAWLAHLEKPQVVNAEHARARLGAIVRNRAVSLIRSRKRRRELEEARRDWTAMNEVEQALAKVELYQAMLGWILELDEPYRDLLLLRYSKGLEPIVIARRLNLADSTVRVRLKRGLAQLRARFDREYEERDRVAFGMILFGIEFGPRQKVLSTAVLVSSLSLLCAVAVLMGFHGFGSEPRQLAQTSTLESPGVASPSFLPAQPQDLEPTPVPSEGQVSTETANLVGMIRLVPLQSEQIEVLAFIEPFMTSAALETPLLQPLVDDKLRPLDWTEARSLKTGSRYDLAVSEAGRYRIHLALPGAPGLLTYWMGTDRPTTIELKLISQLELKFLGSAIPYSATLRYPEGDLVVDRSLKIDAGSIHELGPFMPGVRLLLGHPEDTASWLTRLLEGEAEIELPRLTDWSTLKVSALAPQGLPGDSWRTSRGPFEARIIQSLWVHETRGYKVDRPVVDGSCRFPVPQGCDFNRSSLRVEAPGYSAQSFPLNQVPAEIKLEPKRIYSASLLDEQGLELAGVDVVLVDSNGPRWRGRTDQNGRFDAEELSQFAPSGLRGSGAMTLYLRSREPSLRARIHFSDGLVPEVIQVGPKSRPSFCATTPDGKPVDSASARIIPFQDEPILSLTEQAEFQADSDGLIELPSFVGGPWLAIIAAPGLEAMSWVLPEASRERIDVVLCPLQLQSESSLRFHCLDEDGKDLAHVRVEVTVPGFPKPFLGLSDSQGNLEFRGLETGSALTFNAIIEGRVMSLSTPRRHSPGAAALPLRMLRQQSFEFTTLRSLNPGVVQVSSLDGLGRSRILDLNGEGRILLSLEPQKLEILLPGYRGSTVDFAGHFASAIPQLVPGPVLTLKDPSEGTIIEVSALILRGVEHEFLLSGTDLLRFDGLLSERQPELSLSPGRYRLSCQLRDGRVLIKEIDMDADCSIAVDTTDISIGR